VLAKAPVPGRVKTRLCPPCTPDQAARVAAAALADTVDAVSAAPASRRTLVVAGPHPAPAGWSRVGQRGDGLGARLAHAFADTRRAGTPSLLLGMDTPQLTADQLAFAAALATSLVVNDSPNDVLTAGLVGYVVVEAVMLRDRCAALSPSPGSSPGSPSSLQVAARPRS